ncbi:MAG: SCP2 sterol-binding domain-containing protein [Actinobacteria bacterium]|nr:SCP2 sterol-binding domain-containing protein [Actinomycetota bacterium]
MSRDFFERILPRRLADAAFQRVCGSYQFHISGEAGGRWYVDLRSSPARVGAGEMVCPDCTVLIQDEDWHRIEAGDLRVALAMVQGKLQVEGDLGLALKLQDLLC